MYRVQCSGGREEEEEREEEKEEEDNEGQEERTKVEKHRPGRADYSKPEQAVDCPANSNSASFEKEFHTVFVCLHEIMFLRLCRVLACVLSCLVGAHVWVKWEHIDRGWAVQRHAKIVGHHMLVIFDQLPL